MAKVKLEGALALVTGAGSGIGRATSLALADAGTSVLAIDLDEGTAKATADLCADRGVAAAAYQCDVGNAGALYALAERVEQEHGALDVLVNNAGVGMNARLLDMAPEDWEWIRSINLDGVVHGCRAFGPGMVARGRGHVVNMSSGLGYLPLANTLAYSTTKAAVLAFSRALRSDWGSLGVGVSAVCPGVINTPILERTRFLGEAGEPSAVACAKRGFSYGHGPDVVARAVLMAIRRNRAMVPAGIEARVGWHLAKVTPLAVSDIVGRPAPMPWLRRGGDG
jgi:2-hydroxycyclohexanecarboxyl-CoA dehydrogenase